MHANTLYPSAFYSCCPFPLFLSFVVIFSLSRSLSISLLCSVINLSWLNSWKWVRLNIPLFRAIHSNVTTPWTETMTIRTYIKWIVLLFSLQFACNFICINKRMAAGYIFGSKRCICVFAGVAVFFCGEAEIDALSILNVAGNWLNSYVIC